MKAQCQSWKSRITFKRLPPRRSARHDLYNANAIQEPSKKTKNMRIVEAALVVRHGNGSGLRPIKVVRRRTGETHYYRCGSGTMSRCWRNTNRLRSYWSIINRRARYVEYSWLLGVPISLRATTTDKMYVGHRTDEQLRKDIENAEIKKYIIVYI